MRREWFLAAAVLLPVACSGDDDASSTTTEPPPATSAQPTEPTADPTTTTTAPPTTNSPPTTTSPASTAPTSTQPPPTDPVTTTLPEGVPPRVTFPDDPEKQAVVDAVYAYFDALNGAQAAPNDDAARTRVEATMTAPVVDRVVEYLDRLAEDGEAFIDLGGEATSIEIYEEVLSVVGEAALVDACVVDRTSHVEVGGADDGTHRIIDDKTIAAVVSYSLVRQGGLWLVSNVATASRFEGEDQCA